MTPARNPAQGPEPHPQGFAVEVLLGFWLSRAIWLASRLRIADAVGDAPADIDAIAQATGTHAPALRRLLDALASVGIFRRSPEGRYGHTPKSQLLRSDHPHSQRSFFETLLGHEQFEAWGALEATLRTGTPGFDARYGMPWTDYFQQNPEAGARFAEAMSATTRLFEEAVFAAHTFQPFSRVVDVGGSHGTFVRRLLDLHPSATGLLFDRTEVVAGAASAWSGLPESARLDMIAGDFFTNVPAGGDLYVLKHILHDWDDEAAKTILANIRKAVRSGGRIAIIEVVLPDAIEPSPNWFADLNMLAMTTGRERTLAEFKAMLAATGFRLDRVTATASPLSVIEAVPV